MVDPGDTRQAPSPPLESAAGRDACQKSSSAKRLGGFFGRQVVNGTLRPEVLRELRR